MTAFMRARALYGRLLEGIVVTLMVALTTVVVAAVLFRKFGASLSWYDEVASVLLAWLTYYGAALAALRRAHIGFEGFVESVAPRWRLVFLTISESCITGFFLLLAWVGMQVLDALEGDTLVSLPWVPVQFTQSVIPIGAALFILAQLMSLPEVVAHARGRKGDFDQRRNGEGTEP